MLIGILLPFAGTVLGSACVFFLKSLKKKIDKLLTGFAAGVMVAASVWSLLIPAMEQSENMGRLAFVPASVGFLLGIGFLLCIDEVVPHLHMYSDKPEGIKSGLSKHAMMLLAVTIHNIPEGMAVGVVLAAMQAEQSGITIGAALALAIGIAIQNFPEGAIISMPLCSEGIGKKRAFFYGVMSGVVEPVGGFITILIAGKISPILPYFLSFAAGAMLYVVVEELIPEAQRGEHSNIGTIGTAFGFALMMVLDVALG